MRILNGVLYDMKFQLRHGFYYAYIFLSLIYIAILKLLPEGINTTACILIIFSDPGVLGAFFIGAIFLLERSQNTLQGLFITPFKVSEYIISKVISLTIISFLSCVLISVVSVKGSFNIFLLFLGVVLTSIFYTLLGFIIAVYSKSVNQYLLNSTVTVVFLLPVVEYLNIFSNFIFYLLPGKASLLLIHGAFNNISTFDIIYSVILLSLWCLAAYFLLIRVFNKKVIVEIGG